jgi:hypothetical protein
MDETVKRVEELWNAHQQRIGEGRNADAGKVDKLWTERAERQGASGVFRWLYSLVLPLLGLAATTYGGWLYIQASELLSRGPGTAPVGAIVAWPAESPPPAGWRECDGTFVDFEANLWSSMRALYGNPNVDSVEKIMLPDFRGYFLRGRGQQRLPSGDLVAGAASDRMGALQAAAVSPLHMSWRTLWTTGVGQRTLYPRVSQRGMGQGDLQPFVDAVTRESVSNEVIQPEQDTRPANYAVQWIMRVK